MKRIIKCILITLELAGVGFLVHFLLNDEFAEWSVDFVKYVSAAVVVLTTIWIVIFCFHMFKKEIGDTVDGGVKYHADKIRTPKIDLNDTDSNDVYSNFERAEFAPKVKESYELNIRSFPESFEKPVGPVVEPVDEPIPPVYVPPVVKETKKVTKKEPQKVVEEVKETKVIEPVVEVVEEVKEIESPTTNEKVEVVATADKPAKHTKLIPLSKVDTVGFSLFEGHDEQIGINWFNLMKKLKNDKEISESLKVIKAAYEDNSQVVYPNKENLLKPFELTDLSNARVVIIGKIPHYRKSQADGLAFSTNKDASINQATNIIIKEAMSDVEIAQPANGSFEKWAKNGVFLFNTCLTAPNDKPASHSELWEKFSNAVIKELVANKTPKVFILWGEHAQSFKPLIEKNENALVLEAPNPSPLSAANGFFGSKPFSKANEFLKEKGYEPIDWNL